MSAGNSISREVWRPIPGIHGYKVSSHGRIRSYIHSRKGRLRKLRFNKITGYLEVSLSIGGYAKYFTVHRLVAQAFLGTIEPSQVVNHKDRHRTNNRLENLEIIGKGLNAYHTEMFDWIRIAVRQEFESIAASFFPGCAPPQTGGCNATSPSIPTIPE